MNRWVRLSAGFGAALALVVFAGYYAAQACDGSKSKAGVQKASASGECSYMKTQQASSGCASGTMQQASSGCASGTMKQASMSAADCAKFCGSGAMQASGCSVNGLSTVQLVGTDGGFRVYTVGCKKSGQSFLEKSAHVLNEKLHVRGEIHEASDGVYLDVEGDAAKQALQSWQTQAKSDSQGCLLVTKDGECLFDAAMLAPMAG